MMPAKKLNPSKPVFLRVGDWNVSNPKSWNHARGKREKGLSVYALDDSGKPIIPDVGEWADVDFHQRMRSEEPKYLVQGRVLKTMGHDGEPLLSGVYVVGEWSE